MQYLSIEIQSFIVFISEIVFLHLKTTNVQAISKGNVILAIASNSSVSIAWIIGVTISVNSVLNSHFMPLLAFLFGGAIGTYLGMRRSNRTEPINFVSLRKNLLASLRIL